MFLLIPTGTDAPIYHWPFATVGVIWFHIVVLVLQILFPEAAEPFMLHYGTVNPLTWFTAMCMHAGVVHLIGNLIGIGLFGWIVEGKIGWWRFLIVYFSIGTIGFAFAQLIMLFAGEGAALGASGAIYGLIALAMIWAPENEVRIFYLVMLFLYPIFGSFEVTMSTLGFIMIGGEFLSASFTGFSMSSAILHLLGVIPGIAIGYLMIKRRMVDCDGYDLVSIMNGKRGKRVLTMADEKAKLTRIEEAKLAAGAEQTDALAMVDKYINTGHYEMALNRFAMLRRSDRSLVMTERQLVKIINAFNADDTMKLKAVPVLQSYLEHYARHQIHFTLMLARTHVLLQERPRQGLKVLQTLRGKALDVKQTDFAQRLVTKAQQMIADGILEIDE